MHNDVGHRPEVPVVDTTAKAVVSPVAITLRDEIAVSGQRLLAAGGQILIAAHSLALVPTAAAGPAFGERDAC
jgi:hypothetical protein